ncbi:MAG: hypothetical protein AB7H96_20235 [Vicinamibacterales bacterium]
MKARARSLFCLLVLLATGAPSALAQTGGTFAIGPSLSMRRGMAAGTKGEISPGIQWRFGHGRNGWGWHYGLSWYSTDLDQPVGAEVAGFGELRVRPFLGGYGYSRRVGRTLFTAKLMGGYAINSFELLPTFDDRYRASLNASTISADASNTLVLKPDVSAWVDLSRKVGLNISLGYMVARPDVTVSSSLGRDTRQIKADVLMFRVGAVYSIF